MLKSSDQRGQYDNVALQSARSESGLDGGDKEGQNIGSNKKTIFMGIIIVVIACLVIFGIAIFSSSNPGTQASSPLKVSQVQQSASQQYRFQVFCPISKVNQNNLIYTEGDEYFNSILKSARLLRQQENDDIDKYIIYVQRRNVSTESRSNLFFYCSMVTDWVTRDCTQAKAMCTTPGPIFYVEKDRPIDVAWVYNIKDNQYSFASSLGICYNEVLERLAPKSPKCMSMRKKPGKQKCTYLSPTHLTPEQTHEHNFYITTRNIPMSVHIHGLEVRPSFDGNPLAWMGRDGAVGVGFTSLLNEDYYANFKDKLTTSLRADPNSTDIYVKVNRYDNVQAPGNLWYHDHAMHSTLANVALGMAGDYIIHQKETDDHLPSRQYEVLIVAGQNFNEFSSTATQQEAAPTLPTLPLPTNNTQNPLPTQPPPNASRMPSATSTVPPLPPRSPSAIPPMRPPGPPLNEMPNPVMGTLNPSSQDHSSSQTNSNNSSNNHIRIDPAEVPFVVQNGLSFERNQTYRIRILNAQFDSVFTNLTFRTECDQSTFDANSCKKILKFSVIGSDSSLFDKPIHNLDRLTLSSAQRFEILIIFDGNNSGGEVENPINDQAKHILMVSGKETVKTTIPLLSKAQKNNKYGKFPSEVDKIYGVTFYDLNQIDTLCNKEHPIENTTMCISTVRMRPMFRDYNFSFFFNGHLDFSKSGRADNPKIGTTEDWIFINTMVDSNIFHPIHVHLINFQIIAATKLKKYSILSQDQVAVADELTIQLSSAASFGVFGNPLVDEDGGGLYCSYYTMDYYIEAGLLAPNSNLTELCLDTYNINLKDSKTEQALKDKFPEDEKDPHTLISGFDVFAKLNMSDQEEVKKYYDFQCPNSEYKYVCAPLSKDSVPKEYKKWKEVVLLHPEMVVQTRIRWASNEYNTSLMPDPYPYFRIPEDQLIEFPGFVYHCHFLNHQDNELMRSFMMEPSDKFAQNFSVEGSALGSCMEKKGLSNNDGWKARYQCINEISGCV